MCQNKDFYVIYYLRIYKYSNTTLGVLSYIDIFML